MTNLFMEWNIVRLFQGHMNVEHCRLVCSVVHLVKNWCRIICAIKYFWLDMMSEK